MADRARVTIVIPARYASTRFPGKPLARIAGKPMIQWVWERAGAATLAGRVLIATDDARIADAARAFGAECMLTRPDHPSGTDRVAEVAINDDGEIFVNVQGDEPLIRGDVIDAVVAPLLNESTLEMATACRTFKDGESPADPHLVKVVCDRRGNALYFSRSPIPYIREAGQIPPQSPCRLHLGLYAYRRELLLQLAQMPPTPLEEFEKLEQLRALESGFPIRVVEVDYPSIGVDRPEDIARAEALLR